MAGYLRGILLGLSLQLLCLGFGLAGEAKLPGQEPFALSDLNQLEGRLELDYHRATEGQNFKRDRGIEFRFSKPFKLWARDTQHRLQISMNEEEVLIYDSFHGRVISLSLGRLVQGALISSILDYLDFEAFLDPKKLPGIARSFTIFFHRGDPPPDRHEANWSFTETSKDDFREKDFLVLTPKGTSLYRSFLGLGRLLIELGENELPCRFLYYRSSPEGFYQRVVTIEILDLKYNQGRVAQEFELDIPDDTERVEAGAFALGFLVERLAKVWQRFKGALSELGRQFFYGIESGTEGNGR